MLNSGQITGARIAFNKYFTKGLSEYKQSWNQIADLVTSETDTEDYGWVNAMPKVREWIGDRQVQSLGASNYTLTNRSFESTVGVKTEAIEDNKLYSYFKPMELLGRAAAQEPDEKIWQMLPAGLTQKCHDDLSFFNAAHPIGDSGETYSNFISGGGDEWYLVDSTQIIMPFIYQLRKKPNLVALTEQTQEGVFMRRELLFGVDFRAAYGFTLPQLALCSQATLDATAFDTAYTQMSRFKGDNGQRLNIRPNLLIVPPELRTKAKNLVKEYLAGGESNINHNEIQVVVSKYL